ncbi:MAG: VCBS repeat-containing protein [Bacteroidetes bacterium]|nr:VCBS repeat-containing protein [Bacteroidota bacterium]
MRTPLTLLAIGLGLPAVLAQDQCTTALPITAGTYTVTGIDGPEIPSPICAMNGIGASGGEWYTYTPTADHALTVTTDLPQNAGGDTRFHVYTGTCGALTCKDGDDDSGAGLLSTATFNVTAGVTYTIAFDDRWSAAGFDFRLIEQEPIVVRVSFTGHPFATDGWVLGAVDLNGDHLDDIVAIDQTLIDVNYQQPGGGLARTSITTTPADFVASWSLAVGDLDGNGYNDLLYGGGGGVTFMYANADGTAYTEVSGPEYVFSQRSNMVDINNDGNLDGFVCHDVQPNVYYLNNGDGTLTFHQGGLGDTPDGGNYGSIWIDYDNDHDIDLFIAKCRGAGSPASIDQLHRNNGDGTFTDVAPDLGFADQQQSWSAAWGDFDNDGDMDVLVGASSFTGGGHKLMRNDDNGAAFTNVTPGSGWDVFQGQDIEHVAYDFDNDGYLDVFAGDNTIMMNNHDLTFSPEPIGIYHGPIGDLNNDGFLDIVSGETLHLNDGNANHHLTVVTVGTVSNPNGIGARVEVTSALGTQIRDVRSGDGFRYMNSLNTHFGLGADTEVDHVTVHWPSGLVSTVEHPAIDGTLVIIEGETSTGLAVADANALGLFPVPADDQLNIRAGHDLSNSPAAVLDIAGKRVFSTTLRNDRLDVSRLAPGMYVLQVADHGTLLQARFTKR